MATYHHSSTEGPVKCTWKPNTQEKDPHRHVDPYVFFSPVLKGFLLFSRQFAQPKIMDSVLENIGRTPLVRLNRVGKEDGLACQLRMIY